MVIERGRSRQVYPGRVVGLRRAADSGALELNGPLLLLVEFQLSRQLAP